MIKYYRLPWNEILWGMSYRNLQMLMSVIPDPDLVEVQDLETIEDFENIKIT